MSVLQVASKSAFIAATHHVPFAAVTNASLQLLRPEVHAARCLGTPVPVGGAGEEEEKKREEQQQQQQEKNEETQKVTPSSSGINDDPILFFGGGRATWMRPWAAGGGARGDAGGAGETLLPW